MFHTWRPWKFSLHERPTLGTAGSTPRHPTPSGIDNSAPAARTSPLATWCVPRAEGQIGDDRRQLAGGRRFAKSLAFPRCGMSELIARRLHCKRTYVVGG